MPPVLVGPPDSRRCPQGRRLCLATVPVLTLRVAAGSRPAACVPAVPQDGSPTHAPRVASAGPPVWLWVRLSASAHVTRKCEGST